MIIHIADLRDRDEPFLLEKAFEEENLQLRNDSLRLTSPAQVSLRVSVLEVIVRVRGRVQASLELICGRCLTGYPYSIDTRFDLEYHPDPENSGDGEELALTYPDLEIGFYRDEELDLGVVISEQIVLSLPMKPVCRADCKGLCDQCGADLNQIECGCRRTFVDPRLAVLEDLKKRIKTK